jgi:hypothetical protein
MGTSIAMLERHYSHLEVLHRAEALAGRTEQSRKVRSRKETKIYELEEPKSYIDDFDDNLHGDQSPSEAPNTKPL